MRIATWFLMFLAVLSSGCMPGGLARNSVAPAGDIAYVDTDAFDLGLSSSMGTELAVIEVSLLAPASLNALPERLNKWLGAVSETGGTVEVDPKTRSVGMLLEMAAGLYKYLRENALYQPAAGYNAVIRYAPEDGRVNKIVFTRRGGQRGIRG